MAGLCHKSLALHLPGLQDIFLNAGPVRQRRTGQISRNKARNSLKRVSIVCYIAISRRL